MGGILQVDQEHHVCIVGYLVALAAVFGPGAQHVCGWHLVFCSVGYQVVQQPT